MTTSNPARPAAHRVFAAINARDLSAIDEAVTADFVDHGSPVPLPPGPAGYRQVLSFVTTVLDVSYEILDEVVTEDRIVFRALGRGRGVAEVHGPAAAGKAYAMETVHIYRTEGDRLAEHWGVRDELSALVQLGVVPPPSLPALPVPDRVTV